MKPLCEMMSLEVLPGVRAIIANLLISKYGLTQKQAAERMGTTQPAISQYRREHRGRAKLLKRDPNFMDVINSITKRIASGELSPNQAGLEFCEVCKYMRSSGLACEIHRNMYPGLENCRVCLEK